MMHTGNTLFFCLVFRSIIPPILNFQTVLRFFKRVVIRHAADDGAGDYGKTFVLVLVV